MRLRSSRSAARLALSCAGAAVLVVACSDRASSQATRAEPTATTSQPLIAMEQRYTGADLPAKQLVLTFDDGPGPLAITGNLSAWLKNRPAFGRPAIHATFFVNGSCIQTTALPDALCTPIANPATVLNQVISDGHLLGNHTTTHRDIVQVPVNERLQELTETDAYVAPRVPWNRLFFRAPFGSWEVVPPDTATPPFTTLSPTAMNKYVGPIYWTIGGGPTDATRAADWECWDLGLTTKDCGDRYLAEIHALGRGIVLMHDTHGDTSNHQLDNETGNTVDMVKYIVPILESEGYTFKTLDQVPTIAAALRKCHASCATCSGPNDNQCTTCSGGKFLSNGVCKTCKTCALGTYRSAACTATADTVCAACKTCPGRYVATACTATANTVCGACHPTCTTCSGPLAAQCGSCPANTYRKGGTCTPCTTCGAGKFTQTACGTTTDTVCASCPPGTASSGTAPGACTECADGTFTKTAGATSCTSCATCDDDDACTTDTCSKTAGCSHAPVAGCTLGADAGTSGNTSGAGASSGTSGSSDPPGDGDGDGSGGIATPDAAPSGDAPTGYEPTSQSGCTIGRLGSSPVRAHVALLGLLGLALVRRRRHVRTVENVIPRSR